MKSLWDRRRRHLVAAFISAVALASLSACGGGSSAPNSTDGTLVIAMTASDIPNMDTVAVSQQGYEGYRFVGNSLYDGLTKWDLQQDSQTPTIIPGLAESWEVSEDKLTWTFKIRQGVTFHDGTELDADAVVYNFDRYLNPESPQYNAELDAQAGSLTSSIESYAKVDDSTMSIATSAPNSHLDADIALLYIASPTAIEEDGEDFSQSPVGTGPFKFESLTRGQEAVFLPNDDYWAEAPKVKRLVLRPIPDASARLAALRSGEVNWAEAPTPDDIAGLESDGFQVLLNSYDHVWPWLFDVTDGPLSDARVRRALNLAIDRETMATNLLKGTADAAYQIPPIANFAYDKSNDAYEYNPDEAMDLLAEAGYADGFSMSVSYPTSGSGNMQPGPMNQLLQADLAKIGVQVELMPIEWAALGASVVSGKIPDDADALNMSLSFMQEDSWANGFVDGGSFNVGKYQNSKLDPLFQAASEEFDMTSRSKIYAEISKILAADSPWLVVVNDRNPRALGPDVKGFVQPKSWFVDLTTISVGS